MKLKYIIFFLVIPVIFVHSEYHGPGRKLTFSNLSGRHGLSNSIVLSFCQDSEGFLWVGTGIGLNRYDGFSFKTYFHKKEDPGSLSSNHIKVIYEDSLKNLWIGTGRGLNRYNPDSDSFERVRLGKEEEIPRFITSISEVKKGVLMVGTGRGLFRYSFKNGGEVTEVSGLLKNKGIYKIHYDSSGFLWVGTPDGLFTIDSSGNIKEFAPFNLILKKDRRVNYIAEDRFNRVWVSTLSNGLFCISERKVKRYENQAFNSSKISERMFCMTASDSFLWIGSMFGLARINFKDMSPEFYFSVTSEAGNLSQNDIRSLYSDRNGNIWIGSLGGGVDKVNALNTQFRHVYAGLDPESDLNNKLIWSITEDKDGNIWAGSDNGINFYDIKKRRFRYIRSEKESGLVNDIVVALCSDMNGDVWAGTVNGVTRFFRENGKIMTSNYNVSTKLRRTTSFINIAQDRSSRLWLCTSAGLYFYNKQKDNLEYFSLGESQDKAFPVRVVFPGYFNKVWVGTVRGLYCIQNDKHRFVDLSIAGINIVRQEVYDIEMYDQRHLILITRRGPLLFDTVKETCVKFDLNINLPALEIRAAVNDFSGNLWFSTTAGLIRYKLISKKSKIFRYSDGLKGTHFFRRSKLLTSDGFIYFGGASGITVVNSGFSSENMRKPSVLFTDFYLLNRLVKPGSGSVLDKSVNHTDLIELDYDENFFSFRFAGSDLTKPEKNRYMYMLDGVDKEWIKADSRERYATYTNIGPGTYIFKAKVSNCDGLFSDARSIKINISPPFWKSFWFKVLIIILIIYTSYAIYKKRFDLMKRRVKRETFAEYQFERFKISQREQTVVKMLLKGRSRKDIEEELFISEHTVKNHIYNIYKKTGVKSRVQLLQKFDPAVKI